MTGPSNNSKKSLRDMMWTKIMNQLSNVEFGRAVVLKERSGNPGFFLLVLSENLLHSCWYLELNYDIVSLSHIFRE